MKKGTIAARVLTLLLTAGMLSQNVVTVYADETGDQPTEDTTYTITYQVEDSAQGSVKLNQDGAEGKESDTETVTVTSDEEGNTTYSEIVGAVAESADADKYTFVNWTVGDEEASTEAAFKPDVESLSGNVTYTAHFEAEAAPQNDDAVADGKARVESTGEVYESLAEAIQNAASDDTIYLGAGTFSTYAADGEDTGIAADKNLTIIGSGTDQTTWNIGTSQNNNGNLKNGDFSLRGAASITFKNMTLQAGVKPDGTIEDNRDYLGFTHIQNGDAKTVVEDCVINGTTFYWGYISAIFKNTTFNAPSYEYALWTYSSPTMTFDGCTFNTQGKAINVYRDYAGTAYTINFKDCTINNSSSGDIKEMFQGTKQVLNINDSSPSGQSYIINISGTNVIQGSKILNVDQYSCSRLFGFGSRAGNNAGHTVVKIEGETVFENGARTDHEKDVASGTYKNGVAENEKYTYSEGYKDDAYTVTPGKWETDPETGLEVRKIVKTCKYCGWSTETSETKTIDQVLPGDILVNDDTEHDAVYTVKPGQTINLTGALQVSEVQNQMADIEAAFKNPDGTSIALSDIDYGFTAKLTVPDGITLPSDVNAVADGLANTYKIDSTTVSEDGKSVTVVFALTDEARKDISTYEDLKNYVDAAGTDGWIKVTIPDVTVDKTVTEGSTLVVKGDVSGEFSATATSAYGTVRSFSYTWSGEQWADGKDAAATDDMIIQLTMKVVVDKINISGTVKWDDADNKDGIRPEKVTIHLLANGEEIKSVESADGKFSFADLPVYDKDGKEIVYTVSEDAIDEYTITIEGDAENGFTIVNKHVPAEAIVVNDPPVKKVVKGDKPAEAATFTFTLAANEQGNPMPSKTEVTIETADSGEAEFGDITFTEAGTYSYTIRETKGDLEGYAYDDAAYVVTYKVTRTAGTEAVLKADRTITKDGAEVKDATSVTFTNTYEAPKTPDKKTDPEGDPKDDKKKSDGKPHKHHDKSSGKTVTLAQTTPTQNVAEAATTTEVPETVINEENVPVSTEEATVKTGDDSMMTVYGGLVLATAAGLVVWTRKVRVH